MKPQTLKVFVKTLNLVLKFLKTSENRIWEKISIQKCTKLYKNVRNVQKFYILELDEYFDTKPF